MWRMDSGESHPLFVELFYVEEAICPSRRPAERERIY
jgi:hypothetical protein